MLERLVAGLLLGIAAFWVGACVWMRGEGVPDWWLPTALASGVGAAAWLAPSAAERAPGWARAAIWILVAVAFAALAYGAVATPSRHWDGAATFDPKVFWLTRTPTLHQPFFAAAGVFHHSPDYPLLQPLLVAMLDRLFPGGGRLVLPGIYLLLCGVATVALQRRGVHPVLRLGCVLAVALTPALVAPGSGAVDSGYSEISLLLATTTIAAGLLTDRAGFLALGALLAIACKPEGLPYALLALTVAFVCSEPRRIWAAFVGIAVAVVVWEPLRQILMHRAESQPTELQPTPTRALWSLRVVPIAAIAILGLDRLLSAMRVDRRGRWLVVLAPPLVGLLALPWLAPLFTEDHGALSIYLKRGGSLYAGLLNLPEYAAALCNYGILRLHLGAGLVMPLGCAVALLHRRIRLPDRDLAAFVMLGLATTALPFVLSPEPDLQHHLRSSLPRLLLHWIGPLWLLSAGWLDALLVAPARCGAVVDAPS